MTNRLGVSTETSLLNEIAELKRRVDDLEVSNKLLGSIPQGFSINVLDPNDGSTLVQMGEVDGAVGSFFYDSTGNLLVRIGVDGLEIFNSLGDVIGKFDSSLVTLGKSPDFGLHWKPGGDGLLRPYEHVPFAATLSSSVQVSSGTFTECYRATVELQQSKYMKVTIVVTLSSGTTGEVRVSLVGSGSSTVAQAALVDGTATVYWIPPATLNAGPYIYAIEARRTSGAGAVAIWQPSALALGGYGPQATTAGAWTYA